VRWEVVCRESEEREREKQKVKRCPVVYKNTKIQKKKKVQIEHEE